MLRLHHAFVSKLFVLMGSYMELDPFGQLFTAMMLAISYLKISLLIGISYVKVIALVK